MQMSSPIPGRDKFSEKSLRRLFFFVVFNAIVVNLVVVGCNEYLVHRQLSPHSTASFGQLVAFAQFRQSDDSLGPMRGALHLIESSPDTSPYEAIFFENHIKFQYPLSSLLPYYVLQRLGATDQDLGVVSLTATWLAVCGTLFITGAIALIQRPRSSSIERSRRETAFLGAAVACGGLLFYPLMKGYALGQIQTILAFGFSLAFFFWMTGRQRTAGAIMGLMTLVKPQYAVFLVWVLLRRKLGAFWSGLATAAAGTLLSCVAFGWRNNLDYIRVLRALSRTGESFAANQSVNGLLNRLLFNGNNLHWDGNYFPPYNPAVYVGTLIASVLFIGFALFYPWGVNRKGGTADFACITLAATLASPVAWEHHYGILLPILVWLWFGERTSDVSRREVVAIGAAYVLTSDYLVPVSALASIPVVNMLQSCLFFGALLVLILLFRSHETPVDRQTFSSSAPLH